MTFHGLRDYLCFIFSTHPASCALYDCSPLLFNYNLSPFDLLFEYPCIFHPLRDYKLNENDEKNFFLPYESLYCFHVFMITTLVLPFPIYWIPLLYRLLSPSVFCSVGDMTFFLPGTLISYQQRREAGLEHGEMSDVSNQSHNPYVGWECERGCVLLCNACK